MAFHKQYCIQYMLKKRPWDKLGLTELSMQYQYQLSVNCSRHEMLFYFHSFRNLERDLLLVATKFIEKDKNPVRKSSKDINSKVAFLNKSYFHMHVLLFVLLTLLLVYLVKSFRC